MGDSVDAARDSPESLSRLIRSNPGTEGPPDRLGVRMRGVSENMRDMATISTGVGQKFSSISYYRAN